MPPTGNPEEPDISEAKVVAPAQTYTGSALTPTLTVTLGGKTLVAGTGYDASYNDNTNAGTATVTVTGIGNCAGTATTTFVIVTPFKNPFVDVNDGTSHAEHILWLAQSGISEGWLPEGSTREFRPNSNVKRGDMAAFLHRMDGVGAEG